MILVNNTTRLIGHSGAVIRIFLSFQLGWSGAIIFAKVKHTFWVPGNADAKVVAMVFDNMLDKIKSTGEPTFGYFPLVLTYTATTVITPL